MLAACTGHADVRNCTCDLTSPSITTTRGCSLCLEAAKHEPDETVFMVRDNDPTKPNRWLVVPRASYDGANSLAQMAPDERLLLWTTAIAKAKEVWGDAWGIAMNGDISRRQCHAHVHVGKLIVSDAEATPGNYIDSPAGLPAIADGTGLWFHPAGDRLHVHAGDQTTETVLMR